MKKLKLDVRLNTDFEAMGISTAEKDYKLCFLLNRALHMQFSKTAEIHVFDGASRSRFPLSCHFYHDAENQRKCYLLKNRQENYFVSPHYRQADYILMVYASGKYAALNDFKKVLSGFPNIQSTFAIPVEQLKNIEID